MQNARFHASREVKFASASSCAIRPDGSFTGYASLFSTIDLGNDIIMPGAFTAALRKRGTAGIRMLYQHEAGQPIGAWSDIREDSKGLFVRGRLTAGVARAAEVKHLLRDGAIDGLSIGFRPVRVSTDASSGARRIHEADLWEISIVTFPMCPGARIAPLVAEKHTAGARRHAAYRAAARMKRAANHLLQTL